MPLSISAKIKYREQFKKLLSPFIAKQLSGNLVPPQIPDQYFNEARSCLKDAWECLENNGIGKRYEREEVIKESLMKFESLVDRLNDCYYDGDRSYVETYSREIYDSLNRIKAYISERWSVKGGYEDEQFYDGIDIRLIDAIEKSVELAIADIASNCEISELQMKRLKGYLVFTAKKASLSAKWLNRAGKVSTSIEEAKKKILDRIVVVNEKMEKATYAEEKLKISLNDCISSFTKLNKQVEALQKINGDANYFIDEIKKLATNLELVRNYFAETTKPNYVILESANLIVEIDELTKSVEKYKEEVEKSIAFCLGTKKQISELYSEITRSFEKKVKEEQELYENTKFKFEGNREEIRNNIEELKTQLRLNHEELNSKKDSMQKNINTVLSQAHKSTMKTFEIIPKDIATIITALEDEMNELYNAISPSIECSLESTIFSFIWEKETSTNVIYDELYNDGTQVILNWENQYEQLKLQNISLIEALMSYDALCEKADNFNRKNQKLIADECKSINDRQMQLTNERIAIVENIEKAIIEYKEIEIEVKKIRSSIKKSIDEFVRAKGDSLADSSLLLNCENLIKRYIEESKRVEDVSLDPRCPVFSWESLNTSMQYYTRNAVKTEEVKIDECNNILQKCRVSIVTMTDAKNLITDISVHLERDILILLSRLQDKRKKHEEEQAKIVELKSKIGNKKSAIEALFHDFKTSVKNAKTELDKCNVALESIDDTSRFEQPMVINKYRSDFNEKIRALSVTEELVNSLSIDTETDGLSSATLSTKHKALGKSSRIVTDVNESVNQLTAEIENLLFQINEYLSKESNMLETDRTTRLTIVRDAKTRNTIGFFPCGSSKIKTANGLVSISQKAVLMLNDMKFNSAGTVLGVSGQDGIDGNLAFPDKTGVRFFLADDPCITASVDFSIKVNNRTEGVFVGSKYEFKRIDGKTVYTLTTADTPENISVIVNFVLSNG